MSQMPVCLLTIYAEMRRVRTRDRDDQLYGPVALPEVWGLASEPRAHRLRSGTLRNLLPGMKKPNAATWKYSSWPERRVVRVDISPMNPKVKCAQLNCGHDVYCNRRPRVDAIIVCEPCARAYDEGYNP